MAHTYQPTDVVLAKVKGYPAWPALIVPTELIPEHVLRNKSKSHNSHVKNATADVVENGHDEQPESEEEDPEKYIVYSSILKFRKFDEPKSLYCVKFFCDDSYIWVKGSDLKLLSPEDCEQWLSSSKKKNKKLVPAYAMAQNGSKGIDVWEFIEYGSAGKPGEDDYVEEDDEEILDSNSSVDYEDEEEGNLKRRPKPKRTSQRQSQKRKTEAQVNARKNVRNTRSKKPLEAEETESLEDEEAIEPKSKKSRTIAPAQSKAKGRSKGKAIANTKPVVELYNYDDDEDWSIVGLGPQDLSAQLNVSPLVSRLSQKKNFDRHSEMKLDLTDRLLGINKLLIDLLIPKPKNKTEPSRDDYEIILDELELALSAKGARDEFITVFQSNAELLTNFRFLFSLRRDELERWELWDQFQTVFISIYDSPTYLAARR